MHIRDFEIVRGTRFGFTLFFYDGLHRVIDLMGVTKARFTVRDRENSAILLALAEGAGCTIFPTEGKIEVEATAALTEAIDPPPVQWGKWDFVLFDSLDEPRQYARGNVKIIDTQTELP